MDKKAIQEKIDEFVEWQPPKPMDDKLVIEDMRATRRHLLKLGHDEEAIDEVLRQIEEDSSMIVDGINITIPKQIKRKKPQSKLCELDCNKVVTDQVIDLIYYQQHNVWVKRCKVCQQFKTPSGEFAKNSQQLHFILKPKKRSADK
jgi:hypothetical protein